MRLMFAVLFVLSPVLAVGDVIYGDVVVSDVTSIYDADTFRVNIEGWPDIIGKRVPIRVNGVDAPEIRGKCQSEKERARAAKQFTVAMLRRGKVVELRNMRRGKYFRILADVYVDGASLAGRLISAGLARAYDGGTREGWCKAI